ncbi:MAG TPA: imidazolonepropionase [Anaerolineales bacterium]|nr:imidazolonepropionase [Anaerolineae bacterium]HIQ00835.1 imidazolonepropionase [Anaerolineales bacterium]
MKADLLIHSAAQLCVLPSHDGGPQRGHHLGDLGLIEDGAVVCADGRIVAVGPTEEVRPDWWAPVEIDASGRVVCPGFVDPHTHVIWAGDRADEFVQRIRGATYQEIMARGGGIMSTVRATRAAPMAQLVAEARPRLDRMLAHGTTTAEVKTGYGLTLADEMKMLETIAVLEVSHPITLVPTFLGAHAVPEEFAHDPDGYVDLVVEEMLPRVACPEARQEPCLARTLSARFCDVFCDEGAFTLGQSRRVLEAARELGLGLKIHADEFAPLGGTGLAVEMGAASADHLVCTPPEEIRRLGRSGTVAVSLPATPFGLAHHAYTPAHAILEAGGILALATDCNPGTAWCESMPFVIGLACRYLRITPAQALVAATLNSAHAVGLGEEVGSLQEGYGADILILNLPDVQHLGYRFGINPVEQVIKGGRVVVG